MKRKDIESNFVVEHGVIVNEGKFEYEPIYAPYFHALGRDGMETYATKSHGEVWYSTFVLNQEHKMEFPELKNAKKVVLWQDEDGNVSTSVYYTEE
jgi:hypothetical protein